MNSVVFTGSAKSCTRKTMSALSIRFLTSAEFIKKPQNEPILSYMPGTQERKDLEAALNKWSKTTTEIPVIIGAEEIKTKEEHIQPMPFDHSKKLAKYYSATPELVNKSIDSVMSARRAWETKPLSERVQVMLKAADLIAGKYRMDMNAATMLGQAKTVIQAEIDSACELIDFLRFNAYYALELEKAQPISTDQVTNKTIYRGLDGFIAAISPFNFTAIGGNLASAPVIMGNVVLWKPSHAAMLSSYLAFKIFREAGLPPGVINFVPSTGSVFGGAITSSPHLAGINFTGSVPTFERLWKMVANNIEKYVNFPRLVGECGGKNFHFIHPSADVDVAAACTFRSAFEYTGQKCSACSRLYVAESMWPKMREKMLKIREESKMGDPREFKTFMSAVIDKASFDNIKGYIDHAKANSAELKIVAGGKCDDSKGYFIEPTIVESKSPTSKLMTEEIFGPVLTVHTYPDAQLDKALSSVKEATQFGLTGAVFAQDKKFLDKATEVLRDAVGNLYLNDKSTGAVVAQQPFGGARKSGTNDKAGGPHYVLKWVSPQTVKITKTPPKEWSYPYMK